MQSNLYSVLSSGPFFGIRLKNLYSHSVTFQLPSLETRIFNSLPISYSLKKLGNQFFLFISLSSTYSDSHSDRSPAQSVAMKVSFFLSTVRSSAGPGHDSSPLSNISIDSWSGSCSALNHLLHLYYFLSSTRFAHYLHSNKPHKYSRSDKCTTPD